ncbi:hypothetical protein [Ectobacillus sp. sgz5001026]|uniref:PglD-related sugar-binding protein n=1 Tax=Ectobacillus sp. sgz5001026 TaxID=3242473 RepID=UPI0036D2F067
MNTNLLIIGAGGHGRAVKEIAEAMKIFESIRFLDDQINSELVIGACTNVAQWKESYRFSIPAFGNAQLRIKWVKMLEEIGYTVPMLVHPLAYVSPSASIELGTVVMPHATIHTNVFIQKGCICSIGSIVDHDAVVESGCHIDCGAIVKSYCVVPKGTKVEAGTIISNQKIRNNVETIK